MAKKIKKNRKNRITVSYNRLNPYPMDVNEVLQLVDRLMVERTGKHLDDVQRAVIRGTWQNQTYGDMAKQTRFHKNYVGDVGAGALSNAPYG